ncbi:hypothetical protein GGF50DRAFT_64441 [Schizophyllum commune]
MPMVTQSDPGSENYGLANAHTALCHWHDPSMRGTLCHRWMRAKKNVKPEIFWSQLRRRWTPGFESILDAGVDEGLYDPSNVLENLVFRYVFIPWLQKELDAWRTKINNTKPRRDKHKILPNGVPNDILEDPGRFGALDFRIQVQQEAINEVRQRYADPAHPVFDLVPLDFLPIIDAAYTAIGRPVVGRASCWEVYSRLLDQILSAEYIAQLPPDLDES